MFLTCQFHQTHLELVVYCDEEKLLIFFGYQGVHLFDLDYLCCIATTEFSVRVNNRVWREVFDLGELVPFFLTIMSLKYEESIAFTHYK
jgi:hypothetical protein